MDFPLLRETNEALTICQQLWPRIAACSSRTISCRTMWFGSNTPKRATRSVAWNAVLSHSSTLRCEGRSVVRFMHYLSTNVRRMATSRFDHGSD
jgi:hypothetical protein